MLPVTKVGDLIELLQSYDPQMDAIVRIEFNGDTDGLEADDVLGAVCPLDGQNSLRVMHGQLHLVGVFVDD